MGEDAPSLPLTVPVADIVSTALRTLRDSEEGLDRDEAYLLARLERGENLKAVIDDAPA